MVVSNSVCLVFCAVVCMQVSLTLSKSKREIVEPFPVDELWIKQPLDHFNASDIRTWQMRYLENNMFFRSGGPIFIFVGGEWSISAKFLLNSYVRDMARELNGTMFYTEHRYFGDSRPTDDTSTDNLKWLSVNQALADLARFITHVKENPALEKAGVIMIGQSYAATLVTWFRLKYPHLVNGVWSSSGTVLAKMDFFELKEAVSASIELLGGPQCSQRIRSAFIEMEKMVKNGNTSKIDDHFKLCHPLSTKSQMEVWHFFYELSDAIAMMVQTHKQGKIESTCRFLLHEAHADSVDALAQWTLSTDYSRSWSENEKEEDCYEINYADRVRWMKLVDWDALANVQMRPWTYLTCAEFGWFQTSTSKQQIFGTSFPLEYFINFCSDIFNGTFTKEIIEQNVIKTNLEYGGLQPNVTNVYSTEGQLDPWRPVGIEEDLNENAPAYVIPLVSHIADLDSILLADSIEMKASKKRALGLIKLWLQNKN